MTMLGVSGAVRNLILRGNPRSSPIAFKVSRTPQALSTPPSLMTFSTSVNLNHGHDDDDADLPPPTIRVNFIQKDGSLKETLAREGDIALRLAQRHDIPMEGACEASLACTTCHCYVEGDHFDRLPEASETEEDLLDQAPFLEINSRLGCQIVITPDLDGLTLKLPRATKNFYVDGHVPTPH